MSESKQSPSEYSLFNEPLNIEPFLPFSEVPPVEGALDVKPKIIKNEAFTKKNIKKAIFAQIERWETLKLLEIDGEDRIYLGCMYEFMGEVLEYMLNRYFLVNEENKGQFNIATYLAKIAPKVENLLNFLVSRERLHQENSGLIVENVIHYLRILVNCICKEYSANKFEIIDDIAQLEPENLGSVLMKKLSLMMLDLENCEENEPSVYSDLSFDPVVKKNHEENEITLGFLLSEAQVERMSKALKNLSNLKTKEKLLTNLWVAMGKANNSIKCAHIPNNISKDLKYDNQNSMLDEAACVCNYEYENQEINEQKGHHHFQHPQKVAQEICVALHKNN